MSGLRRSARSQVSRNPRHPEDHGHVDPYANQANEVPQGMMGYANMGYQHQPASDMGYYNPAPTYNQYHQNPGYSHYQNAYQYQHQYPTHHGYSHVGDVSHSAHEEPHSTSGRTLRARNTGAVASSSSVTSGGSNVRGRRGGSGSSSAAAGSSFPVPPTPGGNMGQDSDGEEDEDDDGDDNGDANESTKSKKNQLMESSLSMDQMVQNCLYYLLLMQHKKVPVKRSDLIKNALNSQHKQFAEVMKKLETILKDVFGMTLVRLEKWKDNNTTSTGMGRNPVTTTEETEKASSSDKKAKGKGSSFESYILVSKFPSSVCDSVTRRDPEVDSKRTVLYLVLATIFMMNKAVDEEVIWKIILEMALDQMVCERKSDLRKFLKSEFVSSGYLNIELTAHNSALSKYNSGRSNENNSNNDKPTENDDVVPAKYTWGPRAHLEYSKYSMLKFVTNRFQGRRPYEFTVQYSMLSKEEKGLAEKDLGDGRDSDADVDSAATSGESGSAIQIKQKKGGRGETYLIDGENTETETEEA